MPSIPEISLGAKNTARAEGYVWIVRFEIRDVRAGVEINLLRRLRSVVVYKVI
jgi:hypothetical protein